MIMSLVLTGDWAAVVTPRDFQNSIYAGLLAPLGETCNSSKWSALGRNAIVQGPANCKRLEATAGQCTT